jgi:glyoxylase-like metal-dependent hydrolase (beta-lactamase superfamily II)
MADKVTVGNVEITSVLDMVPPSREPSMMFPTTNAGDWSSHQDCLEDGQLQLYYGVFVVKSQGQLILVDTGMGPGPHPDRGNITGNLYENLRPVLASPDNTQNTNISPSDEIDIVVHTHLHMDHVGWNLRYQGGMPAPTFRRARYLVPKLDWDHFTAADVIDSAPSVKLQVMPLRRLRKMDLIEGEYQITDEVSTFPTPGHTPGHQSILIKSQGQTAIIVGDVLHNKAQVQEPSWCAGVDTDKDQSAKSREALLERAERDDAIVGAAHFSLEDHIGKVVRRDGRRYWQVL